MNRLEDWRLRRFYLANIEQIGESYVDWLCSIEYPKGQVSVKDMLRKEGERLAKQAQLSRQLNQPKT